MKQQPTNNTTPPPAEPAAVEKETAKRYAPWTEEEVENLERRQEAWLHPYTCTCGYSLIPTTKGWECEECCHKQDWCLEWDAKGEWPENPLVTLAREQQDMPAELSQALDEHMDELTDPPS